MATELAPEVLAAIAQADAAAKSVVLAQNALLVAWVSAAVNALVIIAAFVVPMIERRHDRALRASEHAANDASTVETCRFATHMVLQLWAAFAEYVRENRDALSEGMRRTERPDEIFLKALTYVRRALELKIQQAAQSPWILFSMSHILEEIVAVQSRLERFAALENERGNLEILDWERTAHYLGEHAYIMLWALDGIPEGSERRKSLERKDVDRLRRRLDLSRVETSRVPQQRDGS